MHKISKKIYYHDTDCGGVVYYANYLKYFEEARTEFFQSRGLDLLTIAEKGFLFAVKSLNISYKYPARYGQVVEIKTDLAKVKSASLLFIQSVEVKEILLVTAETKIACISKDFKASLIPDFILAEIKNGA